MRHLRSRRLKRTCASNHKRVGSALSSKNCVFFWLVTDHPGALYKHTYSQSKKQDVMMTSHNNMYMYKGPNALLPVNKKTNKKNPKYILLNIVCLFCCCCFKAYLIRIQNTFSYTESMYYPKWKISIISTKQTRWWCNTSCIISSSPQWRHYSKYYDGKTIITKCFLRIGTLQADSDSCLFLTQKLLIKQSDFWPHLLRIVYGRRKKPPMWFLHTGEGQAARRSWCCLCVTHLCGWRPCRQPL